MANYVCGSCELALTAAESNLIMGQNPEEIRFKVVEVEDEDGKVSKEYFNALGQKVATKQFIGTEEAITLFIYDSYGNLTKVINPEKQESTYDYNLLGWLFQKETVDGGITKYMFNESGQVVLEQAENDRVKRSCIEMPTGEFDANGPILDFIDRPNYRGYTYDAYGRLTKQAKTVYSFDDIHPNIKQQLPMLYADISKNLITTTTASSSNFDLFHDGYYYQLDPNIPTPDIFGNIYDAFVYKFTNNSTYSWRSKTFILESDGAFPISNLKINSHNNFIDTEINGSRIFPEKQLFYGPINLVSSAFHTTTNTILAAGRTNLKGNLSYVITFNNSYCEEISKPVKNDIYNYNSDGNLSWQMQQFNPNGITAANKGFVVRIDYPEYDLNNNLLVENVDVNNDLILDMQYHYTYDIRNRLNEVKVSLADEKENGQLLASYDYNDATGLVTKTKYHKKCEDGNNHQIDQISYTYDGRDRLNKIGSSFYDEELYYDGDMPNTLLLGPLSTIANYNGNINGIKSTYRFSTLNNYVAGSNFETPSYYAYQYDGINRLVDANAYWDENAAATNLVTHAAAHYGDVTYQYDKIGNLDRIKRTIDANNLVDNWKYRYQAGSNQLIKVEGANPNTINRNYTYDASGNLLTDDYRKVNQSIYGRANLPFDLDLKKNKSVRYLYDASDARVFKGIYNYSGEEFELGSNIGVLTDAEYYLRDAAGNTIGILDLNTAGWTWYAFGRERFAKIKPKADQQPDFFPADNQKKEATTDNTSASKQQFISELDAILASDTNIQTQLLKIECSDGTSFWVCENN